MKILIVKLSSLGDIIHTIPAFSCLRRTTRAKIGWVASRPGTQILEMVEGLDEVVLNPLQGGTWRRLRGWDVAVDFQGLLKSALLTYLSGARVRFGFSRGLSREPMASLFYNRQLKEFGGVHVIEKNLALAAKVAGRRCGDPEFPLKVKSIPRIEAIFSGKAVLSVGASWQSKRLGGEKWGEIGRALKEQGIQPILLWGNKDELREAKRASLLCRCELSPLLSVKEVFTALKSARGVISPDSFVLHAASALGKPVLGIYGPTSPERNGPWGRAAVIAPSIDCAPCWKRKCPDKKCMRMVSWKEVVELFLSLLKD